MFDYEPLPGLEPAPVKMESHLAAASHFQFSSSVPLSAAAMAVASSRPPDLKQFFADMKASKKAMRSRLLQVKTLAERGWDARSVQ